MAIDIPNMILVGATARNSGKTTLAVAIIEKYKEKMPVYGIKVTTIDSNHRQCVHGGEGCGACSNLAGDFEITEEVLRDEKKDTVLLLAGGAKKVYWLKTINTCMAKGIETVISRIPKEALIICESNTLRKVVNPGIFVMVRNTRDSQMKNTAAAVIDQADIVFENRFDGKIETVLDEIAQKMNL